MATDHLTALAQVAKGSALDVLSLIRSGAARTRSELMSQTGLSRSTISQRLTELFEANLLVGGGEASSTGGRPAAVLRFNGSAGCVVAAAVGVTGSRVAVVDLAGTVLAEHEGKGRRRRANGDVGTDCRAG